MAQYRKPANFTNGSVLVIISGEDVRPYISANHIFMVDGLYTPYFVAAEPTYSAVANQSTVILTAPYAADSAVDVPATFTVDFTTPDLIPTLSAGDVGTATIFTAAMNRIQGILTGIGNIPTIKANEASASATAAAASSSSSAMYANNAAVSATQAAGSASNAQARSDSATASMSAAAASSSSSAMYANNAAVSATLAAGSASNAQASLTAFLTNASFTDISVSGQATFTASNGTAPMIVTSNMLVANLNASYLKGRDWAAPPPIGTGQADSAIFTSVIATGILSVNGFSTFGVSIDGSSGITVTGPTHRITTPYATITSSLTVGTVAAASVGVSADVNIAGVLYVGNNTLPTGVTPLTAMLSSDATGSVLVLRSSANVTTALALEGLRSRGTAAAPSALVLDDVMFNINARGYSGTSYLASAQIKCQVDGAVSSGVVPGRMIFSTTSSANVLTERMRIDSIGVVTVTANLAVSGNININSSAVNGVHSFTNTGSNGVQFQLFGNGVSTPNKFIRLIGGVLDIVNSAYTVAIFSLTDAGSLSVTGSVNANAGMTLGGQGATEVNVFWKNSSLSRFYVSLASDGGTWTLATCGATGSYEKSVLSVARTTGTVNINYGLELSGLFHAYAATNYIGSHTLATDGIEVNQWGTGDRNSYIDFHASNAVDFSLRIIRLPGIDGYAQINNTGTGGLYLSNNGVGPVFIQTQSINRVVVSATGDISLIGTVEISGGISIGNATKTANYQVTNGDGTILVDTSAGAVGIWLPGVPVNGQICTVKKITTDTNALTISGNTKNIEGAAPDIITTLTTRPSFMFQYRTGSGWWVI